jgi:hypothetical protein
LQINQKIHIGYFNIFRGLRWSLYLSKFNFLYTGRSSGVGNIIGAKVCAMSVIFKLAMVSVFTNHH